jgi:hypothetical protein
MRFVIDGDGYVSQLACKDLLNDFSLIYPVREFITLYDISDSMLTNVDLVLKHFNDTGFATYSRTDSLLLEFRIPSTTFFVLGEKTRGYEVAYCLENNIPVYDLERALFPVV